MAKRWTNWAGNQSVTPAQWSTPSSAADIVDVVREAHARGGRVKVVGAGHSFTAAAVAEDVLVDIAALDNVGNVNLETGEVDVGAGVTIAQLNLELAKQGRALPNLGDIAYQTISGAVSTSTHGTGARLTGIAGQLTAVSLIDGLGNEVTTTANDADPLMFRCAQVGVGALGIITQVRLRTVPSFVLNAVESPAKIDGVLEDLDALVKGNDHFEFFWMPHTDMALTKKNNRSTEPPRPLSRFRHWYQRSFLENTAFGAVCAVGRMRPRLIPALAQVVAASGRLDYSDESFRIFASPRRVRFVEMEYSIPVEACASALDDVRSMIDRRKFLVNFPVEVRFTAADDAVLSTAHGRDSAYIAVHMYCGMDYEPYFRAVEEIMLSHGGRPHWGKMHFLTERELSGMYPEWAKFQVVRQHLDPEGTFENAYVRRVFGSNR